MIIIINYESFIFISVNIIRINNNVLYATGKNSLHSLYEWFNLVYIPNLITKLAIN